MVFDFVTITVNGNFGQRATRYWLSGKRPGQMAVGPLALNLRPDGGIGVECERAKVKAASTASIKPNFKCLDFFPAYDDFPVKTLMKGDL